MKNPTLPEEILLEIFTRLPVKSVGKCKCLSKLWLKNLSTSQFINSHLTRHQEENLLFISDVGALHTIASPIKDETVSKELSGLPQNWKQVLGSCNGLVLLLNAENELFLVNPIMQKQVRVPHPPLPFELQHKIMGKMYIFGRDFPTTSIDQMHGFGYDISKDDYKILTITTYTHHLSRSSDTVAYVFSLKMGVWKRVPCDFRHKGVLDGYIATGAHVNGVIHFLTRKNVRDDPYMLTAFNLADEAFAAIPLPAHNRRSRLLSVSVLRGRLIFFKDRELNRVVKACIMEEDGVQEAWTDFSISTRGVESIKIEPLCFMRENEVVILGGGSLLLSNLITLETKAMVVNGAHPSFCDGRVFVESLVSPFSLMLVAEEKIDGTGFANNTLEAGPSQEPSF